MKINTRLVRTQHEETTRLSKSSASTTSTTLVNLCVVISVVFYLMPQPPERPKHVRVWTPRLRLYTEDEAVFLEEPFATVFAQFKGRTITRHHRTLQQELVSTLCEPRFVCPKKIFEISLLNSF
jgi:predicted PurR-regulated permease PerM